MWYSIILNSDSVQFSEKYRISLSCVYRLVHLISVFDASNKNSKVSWVEERFSLVFFFFPRQMRTEKSVYKVKLVKEWVAMIPIFFGTFADMSHKSWWYFVKKIVKTMINSDKKKSKPNSQFLTHRPHLGDLNELENGCTKNVFIHF